MCNSVGCAVVELLIVKEGKRREKQGEKKGKKRGEKRELSSQVSMN